MLSKLFKGSLLSAGVAGAVCVTTPAVEAQEAPAVNNGEIAFSFAVDVTTNYYFRGFEQEDSGLIVQPDFSVSTEVAEGISVYVGTWQSLHTDETGASPGPGPDFWYESDFYTGVTLALIENFEFDISYIAYLYPGGAFNDIHELDIAAGYDASSILDGLGFGALVAIELRDDNGTEDVYGELSAGWGTDIVEGGDYPVTLDLGATLGLSLDDYYTDAGGDNEFFGYLQFDVGVSTPLAFIPDEYGSWSGGATISFIILNGDVALEDSGGDFAVVGTVGISADY
ncbi:MAG: TorF family putative porin [Planctomycetota bacterium]